MKTAILTKPDGTKFQVNDRRTRTKKLQRNFHTFQSGYLGDTEPEQEKLLPVGLEQKQDDIQTNQQEQEEEPLLPLGVTQKD